MEIGLYIAELLSEQDEVNVPGFGIFVKIRVAGSFDESKNVFNPPSYQLAFKEADIPNSELSQFISNHKNLGNASAEELIKKFVAGIKESLNNAVTVEIKHLGSLYIENGTVIFKAIKDLRIAGSFYGLKPIAEQKSEAASTLQEDKPKQNKDETEVPDFTGPDEDNIEVPDYTQQVEPQVEDDIEAPKARLIPILIISFLAILATLAALFYFDTNFNQFVRNMYASKVSSTKIFEPLNDSLATNVSDNPMPVAADSSLGLKDTLTENLKSDPEPPKTITNLQQIPEPKEAIIYEIIVAAFYKKTEAEEYIRMAETKGMKAKIVENIPGKMHKISMGTFKDEESATRELDRIKKEINKDAWIARVKPLNKPQ